MKKLLFISLLLTLASCTKIYREIWIVERVPNEWQEEIIIPGEHTHYLDSCQEWKCLYYEVDTLCWQHYDTLVITKLEKVVRIK